MATERDAHDRAYKFIDDKIKTDANWRMTFRAGFLPPFLSDALVRFMELERERLSDLPSGEYIDEVWALAMRVYHAGGNNHDFAEQFKQNFGGCK